MGPLIFTQLSMNISLSHIEDISLDELESQVNKCGVFFIYLIKKRALEKEIFIEKFVNFT